MASDRAFLEWAESADGRAAVEGQLKALRSRAAAAMVSRVRARVRNPVLPHATTAAACPTHSLGLRLQAALGCTRLIHTHTPLATRRASQVLASPEGKDGVLAALAAQLEADPSVAAQLRLLLAAAGKAMN